MRWIGKQENGEIIIKPFNWSGADFSGSSPKPLTAAIVHLKTTGFNNTVDEIIELAYLKVVISPESGKIIKLINEASYLNEPSKIKLSPAVSEKTGITKEMLAGQKIDWNVIDVDLSSVDFIISFNAPFERPFLDKELPRLHKRWVDVLSQIPWNEYGFKNKSLESLSLHHGFYFEDNRSLVISQVVAKLLDFTIPEKEDTYLSQLLTHLDDKGLLVIAQKAHYEKRFFFNQHEFSFNKPLNTWYKFYTLKEASEAEKLLNEMKEEVYAGIAFNGAIIEIDASRRFKTLEDLSSLASEEPVLTKDPPGKPRNHLN